MGQALNISGLEKGDPASVAREEGFDSPKKDFKDKGKAKKFVKSEAPAKVKVKKRLRDDKNKGKPKRAKKES